MKSYFATILLCLAGVAAADPSPAPVPTSVMVVQSDGGSIYFDADGNVHLTRLATPDAAVRAFWVAVETKNPLRPELERLRAQLRRCGK